MFISKTGLIIKNLIKKTVSWELKQDFKAPQEYFQILNASQGKYPVWNLEINLKYNIGKNFVIYITLFLREGAKNLAQNLNPKFFIWSVLKEKKMARSVVGNFGPSQ